MHNNPLLHYSGLRVSEILMTTMIDEKQSMVTEPDYQSSFKAPDDIHGPAIPYDYATAPVQIVQHSPPPMAVCVSNFMALSPTFSPSVPQLEIFVPQIELIKGTIILSLEHCVMDTADLRTRPIAQSIARAKRIVIPSVTLTYSDDEVNMDLCQVRVIPLAY